MTNSRSHSKLVGDSGEVFSGLWSRLGNWPQTSNHGAGTRSSRGVQGDQEGGFHLSSTISHAVQSSAL